MQPRVGAHQLASLLSLVALSLPPPPRRITGKDDGQGQDERGQDPSDSRRPAKFVSNCTGPLVDERSQRILGGGPPERGLNSHNGKAQTPTSSPSWHRIHDSNDVMTSSQGRTRKTSCAIRPSGVFKCRQIATIEICCGRFCCGQIGAKWWCAFGFRACEGDIAVPEAVSGFQKQCAARTCPTVGE